MFAMLSLSAFAGELYTWQKASSEKLAPRASFTLAGEKAPVTIKHFRGKVVVVNFWATWCAPCLEELPTLAALQKNYTAKDVVVLAMSVDAKPFAVVKRFLQNKQIAAPRLAHDNTGDFYQPLSASGLPLTYVIDRKGNVAYRFEGATDWTEDEHSEIIDDVLAR
jgi:thiol-disulfide isomerase/thioredoxin